MLQTVLYRVSLLWVEHQHLLQQTVRVWICFWEDLLQVLLIALWQFSNIFAGKIIADERHIIVGWGAQDSDSTLDLVQIVITWEKWCSAEKLSEDAT